MVPIATFLGYFNFLCKTNSTTHLKTIKYNDDNKIHQQLFLGAVFSQQPCRLGIYLGCTAPIVQGHLELAPSLLNT